MRYLMLFSMLVLLLFAFNQTYAQFDNPGVGYGIAAGGAYGNNSSADKWVFQGRGYFQYKLISPILLGQLSVGYTELNAPGVYNSKTAMADNRLLFIPFSLEKLNPFIYGGFGVSKEIGDSGSDFLAMIPMGIGFQTRLGSQMLLEVSGGYNLSLSDKLDGLTRTSGDLNSLTNKKHDGFFGFLLGLMFTRGSSADADWDKDGLTNKIEKELGTDPRNPDTDGDGLSDGDEVNIYKTDPLKADTDGDGLSDGDEVNIYKTNPLKADTDGDGLSDGDEVNKYMTDPLKADTDGDGLSDGDEVHRYKTDPAKADTDGDGLSDGDEINKYKTDPLKIDTDGGGVADGAEVKIGTNPLDSKDDIAKPSTTIIFEKGKKVILRGVNFEFNKATLTRDSEDILQVAYNALVASPDVQVEISGHTDSVGSDEYNRALSLRRAQAVKNWLVQKGIAGNRLKTIGKGETEPVASNDTDEGRAENRRIEFYVR
ncbi:MAG: OmpA family protein [bacterium]|nr:OmpA family protein [bacterium]